MSEVKTTTVDDLKDYVLINVEINAEKFIGPILSQQSYTGTTVGYIVGMKIEKWCQENNIDSCASRFYRKKDNYMLDIWFENEEDGAAFKLRWL